MACQIYNWLSIKPDSHDVSYYRDSCEIRNYDSNYHSVNKYYRLIVLSCNTFTVVFIEIHSTHMSFIYYFFYYHSIICHHMNYTAAIVIIGIIASLTITVWTSVSYLNYYSHSNNYQGSCMNDSVIITVTI